MTTMTSSRPWLNIVWASTVLLLIAALFLKTCGTGTNYYTEPSIVSDTIVTIDTVHTTDTIIAYQTKWNSVEIAVHDTIIKPIHVDIGSSGTYEGFIYYYNDCVSKDSIEICYFITVENGVINDINFDIEYPETEKTITINDTLTIYKDSIINTVTTLISKPKVMGYVGGDVGYAPLTQLPAFSIVGGIKDKKDRIFTVRVSYPLAITVGAIVPITTKK